MCGGEGAVAVVRGVHGAGLSITLVGGCNLTRELRASSSRRVLKSSTTQTNIHQDSKSSPTLFHSSLSNPQHEKNTNELFGKTTFQFRIDRSSSPINRHSPQGYDRHSTKKMPPLRFAYVCKGSMFSTPSKEMELFTSSLRRYSHPGRSPQTPRVSPPPPRVTEANASTEYVERVLTYTQAKNYSKRHSGYKKKNLTDPKNNSDEVTTNEVPTKKLSFDPSCVPQLDTDSKTEDDSTSYDYLKNATLTGKTEVRYLSELTSYIKNLGKPRCNCSVSTTMCPKMQTRYEKHMQEHHNVNPESEMCDERCTPIEAKCKECVVVKPCDCDESDDVEYDKRIDRIVDLWHQELPVYSNECPLDTKRREDMIEELKENLKELKHDSERVEKSIKEIKDCTQALPFWLPGSPIDEAKFKADVAYNLIDNLGLLDNEETVVRKTIATWVDGLPFSTDVNKEDLVNTLYDKLVPLVNSTEINSSDVRDKIKSESAAVLKDLPLKLDSEDDISKFADDLANQLVEVHEKKIANKEGGKVGSSGADGMKSESDENSEKNIIRNVILHGLKDVPEFFSISIMEITKVKDLVGKLADEIKEIKQANKDDAQQQADKKIEEWFNNTLESIKKPLDPVRKEKILKKIKCEVHTVPTLADKSNFKPLDEKQLLDTVMGWQKDVVQVKSSNEAEEQKNLQNLASKLQKIVEKKGINDYTHKELATEINKWLETSLDDDKIDVEEKNVIAEKLVQRIAKQIKPDIDDSKESSKSTKKSKLTEKVSNWFDELPLAAQGDPEENEKFVKKISHKIKTLRSKGDEEEAIKEEVKRMLEKNATKNLVKTKPDEIERQVENLLDNTKTLMEKPKERKRWENKNNLELFKNKIDSVIENIPDPTLEKAKKEDLKTKIFDAFSRNQNLEAKQIADIIQKEGFVKKQQGDLIAKNIIDEVKQITQSGNTAGASKLDDSFPIKPKTEEVESKGLRGNVKTNKRTSIGKEPKRSGIHINDTDRKVSFESKEQYPSSSPQPGTKPPKTEARVPQAATKSPQLGTRKTSLTKSQISNDIKKEIGDVLDKSSLDSKNRRYIEKKLNEVLADQVMRGADGNDTRNVVASVLEEANLKPNETSRLCNEITQKFNYISTNQKELSQPYRMSQDFSQATSVKEPRRTSVISNQSPTQKFITSTPKKGHKQQPIVPEEFESFVSGRPSVSIGTSSYGEQYKKRISNIIGDWIDELPLNLDGGVNQKVRDAMVRDLADNIVDRKKYLQVNPSAKTSEEEETKHLKYQLFRWLNKLVDEKELPAAMNQTESVVRNLTNVPAPEAVGPSFSRVPNQTADGQRIQQPRFDETNLRPTDHSQLRPAHYDQTDSRQMEHGQRPVYSGPRFDETNFFSPGVGFSAPGNTISKFSEYSQSSPNQQGTQITQTDYDQFHNGPPHLGYAQSQGPSGYTQDQGHSGYSKPQGHSGYAQAEGPSRYAQPQDPSGHAQDLSHSGYAHTKGHSGYAQPEGHSRYAQSHGPSGYAQPEGHSGYAQAKGLTGYAQTQGATGYAQDQSHSGYEQSQGPSGYAKPQDPSEYSQDHGHAGYGQPEGHSGYAQVKGTSGYAQSQGPTGYAQDQSHSGYVQAQGPSGYAQPQDPSGYSMDQGHSRYSKPQGYSGYAQAYGPSEYAQAQGPSRYAQTTSHSGYAQDQGHSGYAKAQGHSGYSQPQDPSGYSQDQGHSGYAQTQGPSGYAQAQCHSGYSQPQGHSGYDQKYPGAQTKIRQPDFGESPDQRYHDQSESGRYYNGASHDSTWAPVLDSTEFIEENIDGAVSDWLDDKPFYKNLNPQDRSKIKRITPELAKEIKNSLAADDFTPVDDKIINIISKKLKQSPLDLNNRSRYETAKELFNHLKDLRLFEDISARDNTPDINRRTSQDYEDLSYIKKDTGNISDVEADADSEESDVEYKDLDVTVRSHMAMGTSDWLKDLPSYKKSEPTEKRRQERALSQLIENLKDVFHDVYTSDTDKIPTEVFDKEIEKHIQHVLPPDTPLDSETVKAVIDQFKNHIRAMQSGVKRDPNETLKTVLNEWSDALPLKKDKNEDDYLKRKSDFLAKIKHIRENIDVPKDVFDKNLIEVVRDYLKNIPLDDLKKKDGQFIVEQVKKLVTRLDFVPLGSKKGDNERDINELTNIDDYDTTSGQSAKNMYRQKILEAIDRTLPPKEDLTLQQQSSFDNLKDDLADAYINLHYTYKDDEFKDKARDMIRRKIEEFGQDYLARYPGSPLDPEQLKEDLYRELLSVVPPAGITFQSESGADIIRGMNKVPPSSLTEKERVQMQRIKDRVRGREGYRSSDMLLEEDDLDGSADKSIRGRTKRKDAYGRELSSEEQGRVRGRDPYRSSDMILEGNELDGRAEKSVSGLVTQTDAYGREMSSDGPICPTYSPCGGPPGPCPGVIPIVCPRVKNICPNLPPRCPELPKTCPNASPTTRPEKSVGFDSQRTLGTQKSSLYYDKDVGTNTEGTDTCKCEPYCQKNKKKSSKMTTEYRSAYGHDDQMSNSSRCYCRPQKSQAGLQESPSNSSLETNNSEYPRRCYQSPCETPPYCNGGSRRTIVSTRIGKSRIRPCDASRPGVCNRVRDEESEAEFEPCYRPPPCPPPSERFCQPTQPHCRRSRVCMITPRICSKDSFHACKNCGKCPFPSHLYFRR